MPAGPSLFVLTICVVLLTWPAMAGAGAQQLLLKLTIGGHRVNAEIAATEEARERGLMKRGALSSDRGMLFVFPESKAWCMWMLDTDIPLSAAFIDEKGAIANIAEMTPRTTTQHCASKPVRFVLEMNGGWFFKKGITPGQVVRGVNRAPMDR